MTTRFPVTIFIANFKHYNVAWNVIQFWMCNTQKGQMLKQKIDEYMALTEKLTKLILYTVILEMILAFSMLIGWHVVGYAVAFCIIINVLIAFRHNLVRRPLYKLIKELADDYWFLNQYRFFASLPKGTNGWRSYACEETERALVEFAANDIRDGVFPLSDLYQIPEYVDTTFIRVHRVAHKFRLACAFPEIYLEKAQAIARNMSNISHVRSREHSGKI